MLAKPLGGLYRLWQNKYYLDELYHAVFIRPALWVAEVFTYHWLDRKLIDGILHGVGRLGLMVGHGFRELIDRPLINGAGDAWRKEHVRLGRACAFCNQGGCRFTF